MPCDTKLKGGQTVQMRAADIRRAVQLLSAGLAAGRVKAVVGPQGAIAFRGWADSERDGITDACAYRQIMVSGNAVAKAAIARAEQLAGRAVDRRVVGHGTHSHDGGRTWNARKS